MKTLITGRTGTGKDTLQSILVKHYGWKCVKSYSTRNPRYNGEDTHIFISREEAAAVPKEDKVAVTYIKNGDTEDEYFSTRQQIEDADCYIVDPSGVKELIEGMPNVDFQIVYLYTTDKMLQRKMAIERAEDPVKAAMIFEKRYAAEDARFTAFEQAAMDGAPLFHAKNCKGYFPVWNDYGNSLEEFAEKLNNSRTVFRNIMNLIPVVKKNEGLYLDEKGQILVTYKDLRQESVSDIQFAELLMEDMEVLGSFMSVWLSLPETSRLIKKVPRNTLVSYLYRDAGNNKIWSSIVVSGLFTDEQIRQIMDCLNDGLWFIPRQIGLPENRFDNITDEDHSWFELDKNGFTPTSADPTIEKTADEVVNLFLKAKDHWDESLYPVIC